MGTHMRRIDELDMFGKYSTKGGFALCVIGGDKRLQLLRDEFRRLREDRNVSLIVCTNGFIGPVKKTLRKLGLLEFFDQVYGNFKNDELQLWSQIVQNESEQDRHLMNKDDCSKAL